MLPILAVCWSSAMAVDITQFKLTLDIKRPAVTCSLPPPLDTVLGHALFRYEMDVKGTVFSVEPLYTSVRPSSRKADVEAELIKCLQGGVSPGTPIDSSMFTFSRWSSPVAPSVWRSCRGSRRRTPRP